MALDIKEKTVLRRVTAYGRKPKTALQSLIQARALLEEEGRFCTGAMFRDGDPRDVFEDGSICGSWGACSVGALGLVTGEMPVVVRRETFRWGNGELDHEQDHDYEWATDEEFYEHGAPLTRAACAFLAEAIRLDRVRTGKNRFDEDDTYYTEDPCSAVISHNDGTSRDAVLARFDEAIVLARRRS